MEEVAETDPKIVAIVLAAGMSTRMGQQKLLLPWGKETVIEHIIGIVHKAGLDSIVVVTGKKDPILNSVLNQLGCRLVKNPEYSNGSMVTSLQKGLATIQNTDTDAVMIFLGDQPTLQTSTILKTVDAYKRSFSPIVVPSYQLHQGHPWLVDKNSWSEILQLSSKETMKSFLFQHKKSIQYVLVDTPTILQDMDTPEEFQNIKPD